MTKTAELGCSSQATAAVDLHCLIFFTLLRGSAALPVMTDLLVLVDRGTNDCFPAILLALLLDLEGESSVRILIY